MGDDVVERGVFASAPDRDVDLVGPQALALVEPGHVLCNFGRVAADGLGRRDRRKDRR